MALYVAVHFLCLREELADGDAHLGAGFQHAVTRLAQGQVLAVGGLDELVEGRVVEYRPPMAVVRLFAPHALVVGIDPVLRYGGWRPLEVRADLETVMDVFAQRGAAAQGQGQCSPDSHLP